MPMRELSVVEQREAFVGLATMIGANRSGLCREFGISRKTGYKWLDRYGEFGACGLMERSEPRWCMAGRRRLRLLRRS